MASIQSKKGSNGALTHYIVVSQLGRRKWLKAGNLHDAKILKKQIESLAASDRVDKLGLAISDKRIDDFFREYLDYVRIRTAPNTAKRYKAVVNAFIAFLQLFQPNIRTLAQLNQEHIEAYQRRRMESLELKALADGEKNGAHKNKRLPKPQTVNYEVNVLRSAFLWAQDHNWISNIPTRKVKKLKSAPKRQIRILNEKECEQFLVVSWDLSKRDSRYSVFTSVFQFILNSGLRSGELCNLTWGDVDLVSGMIHVRAKLGWTPKTSERSFYLNDVCLKMLSSMKPREGYVFKSSTGKQLDTDDVRRVLLRVAKMAGINGLTRVHDLRHTFSSLAQMNGVDRGTMAAILGHEDEATTKIYTHQTAEHLKKSVNKVRVG